MKKITKLLTNKTILYIFTIGILVLIPLIKQFSFYLVKYSVISNYDSINTAIILFISLPFLIFIYLRDLKRSKRKIDIYDYLVYILIIAGVIATIFSIDKSISLFGKYYRHEGLLSLMSYYFLFINWKVNGTKEDIRKVLKLVIIIALVNSIYALLQIYTKSPHILRYTNDKSMASGLCGNPNFFGSLIVTALSIITGKFLLNKKIKIADLSLVILLFISLINCQSTGPFLTYFITIFFLGAFLLIKKKIVFKNIIILVLVLLITYVGVIHINNKFSNNRCEMCGIKETMRTGGNGRLEIWEKTFRVVKKNWLVGVGYDNLYLAFPDRPITNAVTFVSTEDGIKAIPLYYLLIDNAHNVYLHTLVSSGIIGLIPYLLLCLFVFIHSLKSKNSLMIILLFGFVAYSIQAFANISVITVAPIYFIIMGLILSIKE